MSTSNMPNLPNLPRGVPRWAIAGLVVLLLIGLGTAIHSAGWSQGYTLGLLTGHAGGDSLTPYLVYRGGHGFGGYGFHPFGFFGGIFRFLALFLVVGLLLKFFGCGRWRMQGGHPGRWHQYDDGPQKTPQYAPQNAPQNAPQPGEQPGQTAPPAGSEPTIWTHV